MQLRYPVIAGRLLGRLERLAVDYREEELRKQEMRANMLCWLFGFTDDTRDWTEENIRAHDWACVVPPGEIMALMLGICIDIADIRQVRDDAWKEMWTMRKDYVEVKDE